jgi:2-aminophenol/2-amino-5-chlorophenol 1,6-dioxygenase alpha subunit
MTGSLKGIYLVPGLPHILHKPDANKHYTALRAGFAGVASEIEQRGVSRILYYSTSWIAVLGQMIQARECLKGYHVDENWHDQGNLNFDFRIDRKFSEVLAEKFRAAKHSVSLVDYEGFPVDTGTIVADELVNPRKLPTTIVANHVYTDFSGTVALAKLVRQAIDEEKVPTAVVVVSGLSGRFFTNVIDWREDAISDAQDDKWNKDLLDLMSSGKYEQVDSLIPEYGRATKADMGFKAYGFVRGLMPAEQARANVLAYGAIYGTGAAVVSF